MWVTRKSNTNSTTSSHSLLNLISSSFFVFPGCEMSGGFQNSRPPEGWPAGQDYWIYLPVNRPGLLPPIRSLNPRVRTRDPWMLVEERFMGGHDHGLASFPPPANPHPSVPLLLIEDSYRGPQFEPPPPYYQPWNSGRSSGDEEPKLSPEEQKQAVNKLRRQLYSPHIYNIIRRLGNKSAASNDDDGGKRCAVCLEDFETKQFVTITPCNHMFHEECIVPWVKSQGKCPVCRFVIIEHIPTRGGSSAASRRGRSAIL